MRYADGPTVEGAVHVAAPPERLWPLVSDIHLIASLSAEVQAVEWLDGSGAPAVGRTFRGHNRHPAVGEWTSISRVVTCEEPRAFEWAVGEPERPAARWRFELVARDDGTELRQWARMGPGPSGLTPAIERMPDKEERIVEGRLREWQAGIDANLAALKELAER
jgi:hypothetical protein